MVFPYPMDPMMAFPYPMDPSLAGQTLFFLFSFYWGRGRAKNNSLVKLACQVRVGQEMKKGVGRSNRRR